MKSLPRRSFVLHSAAALAGAAWVVLAPRSARAASNSAADEALVERARAELARLGSAIPHHDVVAVADYTLPSHAPRFHLIDMRSGRIESFLVAHGRGSDPQHSGRLQRFSNEVGSAASSEGSYRIGERYTGKHGASIRLAGLDETNSNAQARAIVVHSAWYVGPQVLQTRGKLGRSEGCFVFSEADNTLMLERLGADRLLMAGLF